MKNDFSLFKALKPPFGFKFRKEEDTHSINPSLCGYGEKRKKFQYEIKDNSGYRIILCPFPIPRIKYLSMLYYIFSEINSTTYKETLKIKITDIENYGGIYLTQNRKSNGPIRIFLEYLSEIVIIANIDVGGVKIKNNFNLIDWVDVKPNDNCFYIKINSTVMLLLKNINLDIVKYIPSPISEKIDHEFNSRTIYTKKELDKTRNLRQKALIIIDLFLHKVACVYCFQAEKHGLILFMRNSYPPTKEEREGINNILKLCIKNNFTDLIKLNHYMLENIYRYLNFLNNVQIALDTSFLKTHRCDKLFTDLHYYLFSMVNYLNSSDSIIVQISPPMIEILKTAAEKVYDLVANAEWEINHD